VGGGGGGWEVVGAGAGAGAAAGAPPPVLQSPEITPKLVGANSAKKPWAKSRPPQGQPIHCKERDEPWS
jgi:hypothetical protein